MSSHPSGQPPAVLGKPRARDLGIVIGRHPPGRWNAITDVPGVRVGHTTVIEGDSVRTGVTAIHPHEGSTFTAQVPAAIGVLNGAGEITGRSQVDEYGTIETPILLTSTLSVGAVHRAVVEWLAEHEALADDFVIPVVTETYDGFLNDAAGQHVGRDHVFAALDGAASGPVAEGNVGGGTGMSLFQFKGGIGTASRVVPIGDGTYTVGVLVQGNYGRREHLCVAGVPLLIDDLRPVLNLPVDKEGSVVVVVATDAPLTDRQLARLARRAMLGIGRTGGIAGNTSGDLVLAFSNPPAVRIGRRSAFGPPSAVPVLLTMPRLNDSWINPLFEATIEATEEAVLNALVAAETMVGRRGNTMFALPHDRLARRPP